MSQILTLRSEAPVARSGELGDGWGVEDHVRMPAVWGGRALIGIRGGAGGVVDIIDGDLSWLWFWKLLVVQNCALALGDSLCVWNNVVLLVRLKWL